MTASTEWVHVFTPIGLQRNALMMSSYRFQNTWKIPNRVVCGNLRVSSALTSGIILAPGKYGESLEDHEVQVVRLYCFQDFFRRGASIIVRNVLQPGKKIQLRTIIAGKHQSVRTMLPQKTG
jgi:hypothetical protein